MAVKDYSNTQYDGKEFRDVLKALDAKEIRKAAKSSYRVIGRKARKIIESKASGTDLHHGKKVAHTVRVRVYPRGNGFMLTTKPHGKQGYYKRSQDGKEKPVAMWANAGTKKRHKRGWLGSSTGRMPSYGFMGKSTREVVNMATNEIANVLEAKARERLAKAVGS